MAKGGKLATYVGDVHSYSNTNHWELQTPATLLAQAHANAGSPHTPRRDRRERDAHRRASRQVQESATPSTPHVLSPSPAHIKNSSRRPNAQDRSASRGEVSVQALAPNSRRLSQQQRDANNLSPHPYATAPSPTGYRSGAPPGAYGRHSPLLNGSGLNGSESLLYGGLPKNRANSRDGSGTPQGMATGGARGMAIYDRDQMHRVGDQDDDGHGRKGGFWSVLCCRT
jgi:casein kinase 1